MIYDFPVPCITDTKNLKKTFGDSNYVTKESLQRLDGFVLQRTLCKDAMKAIKNLKPHQNLDGHAAQIITKYADAALELQDIFSQDYPIKKNIKWTPILSNEKTLKFGKEMRIGKSGEMIMALYSAFASQLKEINADIWLLNKRASFAGIEDSANMMTSQSNSMISSQASVSGAKTEELAKVALKKYAAAWLFLKTNSEKLNPIFQNLSLYDSTGFSIETQGISVEILLKLTQINANIVYTELLREHGEYEEMGRYAKSIATQAEAVFEYLGKFVDRVNPDLIDFLAGAIRLYKSIALWSLFEPILKRMKREEFGAGESFNMLAGLCCGFANHIKEMDKEVYSQPKSKSSPYFISVLTYFDKMILPKVFEVDGIYGTSYGNSGYNSSYYSKIEAQDYISGMTK